MTWQRLFRVALVGRRVILVVAIFAFSHPYPAHCFRNCESEKDQGLRGQSDSDGNGCEQWPKLPVAAVTAATSEGDGDEDEGTGKKKKLEKDETGSPTSKDMKKIDKAMRKTQKLYTWPLGVRLVLVGLILTIPLLVIALSIRLTKQDELAQSAIVKTAIHCGFSFSIGWINCIMLLRYRVFATMMVGNTILMGVAFVCNGGFSTAQEEAYWTWQGTQVKALCPAQFENAAHYMTMIALFLLGTFVQGLLYKNLGWSARAFAPIVALVIISVEMLEYFGIIHDSKLDVYILSPVFGAIVSISQNCGVGGVPWAATGNMTSAGFNLASFLSGFKTADMQKVIVNTCLWLFFVFGIIMGTFFHSNRTVIFNALYMQGLLYFNGMAYQPPEKRPLLAERPPSAEPELEPADVGCVFAPSSSRPTDDSRAMPQN